MTGDLNPTDHELVCEFAASGDDQPFETLVRRHGALVLGVCRGILRDATEAEDAAQAAFLTLARKASTLRGHRTIAGWLYAVASNVARRQRAARLLRQQRERESAATIESKSAATVRDASESEAAADELHDALRSLPEKYRLALILHHLEGWSEQEVAQILGCKLGTVSGRLSRGREMLRDELEGRQLALATLPMLGITAARAPTDQFVSLVARVGSAVKRGEPIPDGILSTRAIALADGAARTVEASTRRWLIAATSLLLILIGVVVIVAVVAMRRSSPQRVVDQSTTPAAQPRVDAGTLRGVVVDPEQRPAGDVTVRLYRSKADATAGRRAVAQTITAQAGSFSFDRLAPADGYYVLCFVQQPVFMHGDASADVIAAGDADVGTIVLKTGRY